MAQTITTTNAGKAVVASFLVNGTGNVPKWVGAGTGSHTASPTDTALTTPAGARIGTNAPALVTGSVTNDTQQVTQTWTSTTGSEVIVEAGLFDAVTAGTMLISATFDPISMSTIGDSITFIFNTRIA